MKDYIGKAMDKECTELEYQFIDDEIMNDEIIDDEKEDICTFQVVMMMLLMVSMICLNIK